MYIVGDLMKSILVEITCPTCLWHTHKPSDTVVIPEFEPDLKQQLEQEEFYAFTCPRCGTRISYFHTCIYPDKQHHLVLLMKSEKEKKQIVDLTENEIIRDAGYMRFIPAIAELNIKDVG